jgi:hypothetical protein
MVAARRAHEEKNIDKLKNCIEDLKGLPATSVPEKCKLLDEQQNDIGTHMELINWWLKEVAATES